VERLIRGHVIIKPKCVTLSRSVLLPIQRHFHSLSDHLARGAHTWQVDILLEWRFNWLTNHYHCAHSLVDPPWMSRTQFPCTKLSCNNEGLSVERSRSLSGSLGCAECKQRQCNGMMIYEEPSHWLLELHQQHQTSTTASESTNPGAPSLKATPSSPMKSRTKKTTVKGRRLETRWSPIWI